MSITTLALVAAFVCAIVAAVQSRGRGFLVWAVLLLAFVLAWPVVSTLR